MLVLVTLTAVALVAIPRGIKIYRWRTSQSLLADYKKSDYLVYGYQKTRDAARPIFDEHIDRLIQLGPFATDEKKYADFKKCVSDLNMLVEFGYDVETVEREEFCSRLGDLAVMVRLCPPDNRTEFFERILDWRDW